MIIGIGTDIQLISAFENKANKKTNNKSNNKNINQRFLEKLFTEKELSILKSKNIKSYVGFFCVKEAVVKAFGTGFVGITPTDIEVSYLESGQPFVTLHNGAKELAKKRNVNNIHVSISHSGDYAQAFVVLETVL